MIKAFYASLLVVGYLTGVSGECANACNGHGRCTSYDMCICNRNWQANDCSERVCQFGLAHVDTPKGDLDMDGYISGPDEIIAVNSFVYPFGTSEQFPRMQNSELADVTNSAHFYMECSNKGTCNRETGVCECLEGYDGAACQRASCPGYPESCSGHGVCKTISQLAAADGNNIYELWDKDVTMGCECDAGFFGADCSLRACKYGVDPLYLDDTATIKYAAFEFFVGTTDDAGLLNDGMTDPSTGYWAIRLYDMHGEDWLTERLPAGATCTQVIAALNKLPNNVVSDTMTDNMCTRIAATNKDALDATEGLSWQGADNLDPEVTIAPKMAFWDGTTTLNSYDAASYQISGYLYRVHFLSNPGALKEPTIEIYLDGKRPSLQTEVGETVITKVWTDGNQGESIDYFADHCDGVTVTITADDGTSIRLGDMTAAEEGLLKACLGTSDFSNDNNEDIYDWDHGNLNYPHLIKLVKTTASISEGGFYSAIYYDGSAFRLLNNFAPHQYTDVYEVYTTQGVLARVSDKTSAVFDFASNKFIMTSITADTPEESLGQKTFHGDVSCENIDLRAAGEVYYCVNKTDIVTFLSPDIDKNPAKFNLYTVKKIHQDYYTRDIFADNAAGEFGEFPHVIETDLSSNWAHTSVGNDDNFYVYKFFPNRNSAYTYVSQCSNRGLCNEQEGLCECFRGYTGDSCSDQNSLAV